MASNGFQDAFQNGFQWLPEWAPMSVQARIKIASRLASDGVKVLQIVQRLKSGMASAWVQIAFSMDPNC
jgi:hypothetical protein